VYLPKSFEQKDLASLHELMSQYSFATLVTTSATDGLVASHLPLLLDATRGTYGTLVGHLARANHQWRDFENAGETLVIFQGPHTYISPSWYETVPSVPTWNYAVIHAYGQPRLLEGYAPMHGLLQSLVQTHEAQFAHPWPLDLPSDYMHTMMAAIVGFEIEITRLEGKFKLSQNRTLPDQQLVTAALEQLDEPLASHVAAMMQAAQNKS